VERRSITVVSHCLWIVGNGTTLFNSNSVWQNIVKDTRDRGCFLNATDEKELLNAIFKLAVEYPHADNLAGEETRQRLSTRMSLFNVAEATITRS